MRYEIVFAPEAVENLKQLSAGERSSVSDKIERHLRHTPEKTTKSGIRRLRGISRPQYRLRVDEIRVFYDITEQTVEILAIITESKAAAWLQRWETSGHEKDQSK
jgi:mRNA interferase RelE/StbE